MVEELFFSEDGKSLRRGHRNANRRDVERMVTIQRVEGDGEPVVGLALNISLEGIFIQTAEPFEVGEKLMIDVKEGKELDTPSYMYVRGQVMRRVPMDADLFGIGVRMIAKERQSA